MRLRGLWLALLRSDLFFWRQLRALRAMNRALRRCNHELRLAEQRWHQERDACGQDQYWYHRWQELRQRPAYVAQDAELERVRTELARVRAQLAAVRSSLRRDTPEVWSALPAVAWQRDWQVFRRPGGLPPEEG